MEANLPPDLDPDCLYVNATIDPEMQPQVMWAYKGQIDVIGLTLARNRAQQLFEAAAIAESEALVLQALCKLDKGAHSSGFGFARTQTLSPTYGKIWQAVRQSRPPLPDDVEVIFGAATQLPIVNIYWYGHKTQMEVDTARSHGSDLLLAAEAAESDGFFYDWFKHRLDIPPEKAYVLIQEFQQYRERRRLEELFQQSSGG